MRKATRIEFVKPESNANNNCNLRVDQTNGVLSITIASTYTHTAAYCIRANNFRSDGLWQYNVPGCRAIQVNFHLQTHRKGRYDLSVHGPNGFLRRFIGDLDGFGGMLAVTSSYELSQAGRSKLVLTMTNNSTRVVVFIIAPNACRSSDLWTFTIEPGRTVSHFCNVDRKTRGSYDFTATVDADPHFLRRFAGHIEGGIREQHHPNTR